MRDPKTVAEGAAIASFLIVLAIILILWGELTLRESLGLLILAPSGVLLGYYIADRDAPDRIYSIGLFSALIVVALAVIGFNARYLAAVFLIVVASLTLISLLKTSERG